MGTITRAAPSPLAVARWFVHRGISVIPLKPRDKVPAFAWAAYQQRLPTDHELVTWFRAPLNIGLVTGAVSGLVAVDADTPAALVLAVTRLPRTPWGTRTARGLHLFYRHPGGTIRNRAHATLGGVPVDIRAEGGYVVAPGSIHPSGVRYRPCGPWHVPKADLPVFSPTWFDPPPEPPRSVTVPRVTDPWRRATAYLEAVPRPVIGAGSDADVYVQACRCLTAFGLSEADTVDALWRWCGGRAGWTVHWVRGKVAHAARYARPSWGTS